MALVSGSGSFVFAILIILVVCIMAPTLATVYTVGDTSGWAMGSDYTSWTSSKTFAVGDSLVFNYGGGHTVDEVSASDYNTCTVGNALTSDSSGVTKITLKTAGAHYFICGVPGHCGNGMKLAVTVAAAGPSTSTTPSSGTGTPSSGGATTSPAGGNATITNPSANHIPDSSSGTHRSPFLVILVTCAALFVMACW